jgi:hypothetical protein
LKRVAILQSCYIPWKGYFDLINSVDEFVLYDDCQYTRQDWRNRNRIKSPQGTRWLTIPVTVDGLYEQRLDETKIADPEWVGRHWDILRQSYRKAPGFRALGNEIEATYAALSPETRLSSVNRILVESVCEILGIRTKVTWSTDYAASGSSTERVVSLCKESGADVYLSGPRGREYLDEQQFREAGVELQYFEYDGYPEYEQPHPPFEHNVSILDLLFSTGHEASSFMKTFTTVGSRG